MIEPYNNMVDTKTINKYLGNPNPQTPATLAGETPKIHPKKNQHPTLDYTLESLNRHDLHCYPYKSKLTSPKIKRQKFTRQTKEI